MPPIPTSSSDPPFRAPLHVAEGERAEEEGVTRRFYVELVALRRLGGPPALDVIGAQLLDAALAELRAQRPRDALRVACVVELGESTSATQVLRARAALARHGVALDVWPQLAGADEPRFLNTHTAATFQARLLPFLDELARHRDGHDIGLALDLEPHEDLARSAWSVRDPNASLPTRLRAVGAMLRGLGRSVVDARQGRRDLTELARDVAARDIPVHVAVLPPFGAVDGDAWRTWALGCPTVDDAGEALFGAQAAMCYAPLARRMPGTAGWTRAREKEVLALWAARHRQRSSAVVIGPTSAGVLGDEPVYDTPALLAEDVRAMVALGFTDLSIYALEGICFGKDGMPNDRFELRPDADAWLAASVGAA